MEQVDALWNCLAVDPLSSDDCLNWFLNTAKSKDYHALSINTLRHIFFDKVLQTLFTVEALRDHSRSCVTIIFICVYLSDAWFVCPQDYTLHKKLRWRGDLAEIFRWGKTWPSLEVIRFWWWSGSASGSRTGLKDSLLLSDQAKRCCNLANAKKMLC